MAPGVRTRRRVFGTLVLVLVLAACGGQDVPPEFRASVKRAGRECPQINAKLIAAQIEQESGWNPEAVSDRGAQGLAQFMPETWGAWGTDGNGDGRADPFEPADAIQSQGRLMCHLVDLVRKSGIPGDPVPLALAAYNAGWGPVSQYRGVPPFPETKAYVMQITERASTITLRR